MKTSDFTPKTQGNLYKEKEENLTNAYDPSKRAQVSERKVFSAENIEDM